MHRKDCVAHVMSALETKRFAEAFWFAIRPIIETASKNETIMLEVGQQLRTVVAYMSVHANAAPNSPSPVLASSTCEAHIYRPALCTMRVLFEELDTVDSLFGWFAKRSLTTAAQNRLDRCRELVRDHSFEEVFPSLACSFDMDGPFAKLLERGGSTMSRLPASPGSHSHSVSSLTASPRHSLPTASTLRSHSTTDLASISSSSSASTRRASPSRVTAEMALSPTAVSSSILEYALCYLDNEFYSMRSPWDMLWSLHACAVWIRRQFYAQQQTMPSDVQLIRVLAYLLWKSERAVDFCSRLDLAATFALPEFERTVRVWFQAATLQCSLSVE
mmetsp:Transcript_13399/g.40468  ORF Transcript_13399/g.40468 Transcript_13399/m.40468 type:complete len:332 (-) Transcript_13399:24-1019(-)